MRRVIRWAPASIPIAWAIVANLRAVHTHDWTMAYCLDVAAVALSGFILGRWIAARLKRRDNAR